jgi:hypothetical protein
VLDLVSTSVFSIFGAVFLLLGNCTRSCARLYFCICTYSWAQLYLLVCETVPDRVCYCTYVHIFDRVRDYLYSRVCSTVLVSYAQLYSCVVLNCTYVSYVSLLANICNCTRAFNRVSYVDVLACTYEA